MSVRRISSTVAGLACLATGLTTATFGGTSYARGSSTLPTQVNSCWSNDNGAPVLDSFSTTTTSVDVSDGPATIGITVHAHDVGGPGPAHSLGDHLRLQVYAPDVLDVDNTRVHDVTLDKTAAHTWTGTYTVPHNAPASPIELNWLRLKPTEGSAVSVQYNELGPDAVIDITSAHPDTTAPEITDLGVTPDPVDVSHGARRVHLTATVSDDTGLSSVTALVGRHVVSLTPGDKPDHYRGALTIPTWEPRATLPLRLQAADVNGVSTTRSPTQLATAGLPSTLTVRGSHPDHRGPRVHLSLSTQRLRLDPGGWLHVQVHAGDAGSGIGVITLRGLGLPTPGMFVPGSRNHPFHLVSGTRHRGTWASRIHVRCLSTPRFSRIRVTAVDRAGNETSTPRQSVHITGPDRVPPQGDDLSGGGTGDATVTFSEPVHGISSDSVTVSNHGGPAFLTGSWVCWSRRYGGADTSCRHGHVLSATFTATNPNAEITWMDFAPDGHLEVLDRAGNPLLVPSYAD